MKVNNLYAIYDRYNDKMIWNSRGSAYKDKTIAERKIIKLVKENPYISYELVEYQSSISSEDKESDAEVVVSAFLVFILFSFIIIIISNI